MQPSSSDLANNERSSERTAFCGLLSLHSCVVEGVRARSMGVAIYEVLRILGFFYPLPLLFAKSIMLVRNIAAYFYPSHFIYGNPQRSKKGHHNANNLSLARAEVR